MFDSSKVYVFDGDNRVFYDDLERNWSSPLEQWKLRFSSDVLPLIEKGYRLVGKESYGDICINCYFDGPCNTHLYGDLSIVSFEDLKEEHSSWALEIFQGIDFFDFMKLGGEIYINAFNNWKQRLEVINWNQSSDEEFNFPLNISI